MLVQLRSKVMHAERFSGKLCTEEDVSLKLEGDVDVYRPDGAPLVILRRGAISTELLDVAYPALHELRKFKTENRGKYTGAIRSPVKYKDGTYSKNSRTRRLDGKSLQVASAIVGYFDKQGGRFPFCRETLFTSKHVNAWKTIVPMAQRAGELFRETVPDRYVKQCEAIAKCNPAYVIEGTPFTTLTVNNNVAPAGVHKDAGDYKDGLGVISVLRRGQYKGGWLVFPEYRIGADLQHGDVIFFNSHDWHGVTAMADMSEDHERISVVYYMREKMMKCMSPAEQLKMLKGKQSVFEEEETTDAS